MSDRILSKTLAAGLAALTFAGAAVTATSVSAQPYRYYANGRWVDQRGWDGYREREWRRDRYRHYRHDNSNALAAGIIGFALGAAILGSQNDASRAYSYRSDRAHIDRCRARYRSFDAASNTFLGNDGYRHYCTL
jgi:hypothetical protein